MAGRLTLKPGEACQPPAEMFGRILGGLTIGEWETMLIDVSVYHPEAFEEALAEVQRLRTRRALQSVIQAPIAATAALTPPWRPAPPPGTQYGPI